MNYAEDCNYWKTGKSSPDSWIDKCEKLIEDFGGKILSTGFGNDAVSGRAAYMTQFELAGDTFKIIWPVLESKTDDTAAARRQAATSLFHHVKAQCIAAERIGVRASFFAWLQLADGRSAFQLHRDELTDKTPQFLIGVKNGR